MSEVLLFKPLYQERVWGGQGLASSLERTLPSTRLIGESWEIVDRPEAQSIVAVGSFEGQSLRQLLEKNTARIMGPRWPASRPFPILIKWLDCRERLSLQVHPPMAVADALGGEPKTENWYIADTTPGAHLIVGLKRGVTPDQFEKALARNTLETCVHKFPVAKGDSILVHSGQIHAIDAGNLILEIQQNSDTTYRVYDWGRVGLDGKPRQMHVTESLRSINWNDFEPAPLRAQPTSATIADCPEFRIRRAVLAQGDHLKFAAGEQPRLLSVVSGNLRLTSGQTLKRGDNALLPYADAFDFETPDGALVLITENFTD